MALIWRHLGSHIGTRADGARGPRVAGVWLGDGRQQGHRRREEGTMNVMLTSLVTRRQGAADDEEENRQRRWVKSAMVLRRASGVGR